MKNITTPDPAPNTTTLAEIESATRDFSKAYNDVGVIVSDIKGRLLKAKLAGARKLARVLPATTEKKQRLHALIDGARDLFAKPRTRTFDYVKVGLQKQPGKIEIADPDRTIQLIEKHYPGLVDQLAPSTRTLSKDAISKLPADMLKRIAVTVTSDSDKIVIKPTQEDIEKFVEALFNEDIEQNCAQTGQDVKAAA